MWLRVVKVQVGFYKQAYDSTDFLFWGGVCKEVDESALATPPFCGRAMNASIDTKRFNAFLKQGSKRGQGVTVNSQILMVTQIIILPLTVFDIVVNTIVSL
jgi:hypothetical protein